MHNSRQTHCQHSLQSVNLKCQYRERDAMLIIVLIQIILHGNKNMMPRPNPVSHKFMKQPSRNNIQTVDLQKREDFWYLRCVYLSWFMEFDVRSNPKNNNYWNSYYWCLLPVIFEASMVETQHSADKNNEGKELNEHSSCRDHMSMLQNNRNS